MTTSSKVKAREIVLLYRKLLRDDSGFTLVSVIIAFSMFVAVLGPAAALMQRATLVSGNVQNRVVAANLATQELEIVRSQANYTFSTLVTNYLGSSTTIVNISGVPYKVTQVLQWAPGAYAPGGCGTSADGSANLQPVLLATESVTWPAMYAGESPVTESTTFTPPIGSYSATTGNISIQVLGAKGQAQTNVPVTVTNSGGSTPYSQTVNTDSSGCAFFPFLATGNYNVTLSTPILGETYVSPSGATTPSITLGVASSQTADYQFYYDQAAAITFPTTLPNYTLPLQEGLTLANSQMAGLGTTITDPIPSGTPTQINDLFPFPSGDYVWLGTCYSYQAGTQSFSGLSPTPLSPGQTTTATLGYSPYSIEATYNGQQVAGAQVTISMMDPTSTTTPQYNQNCTGPSPSYNIQVVSSTSSTNPSLVYLPLGAISFTASATINGTPVQGVYPPSGSSPPYVSTTSGAGGSIVIPLS